MRPWAARPEAGGIGPDASAGSAGTAEPQNPWRDDTDSSGAEGAPGTAGADSSERVNEGPRATGAGATGATAVTGALGGSGAHEATGRRSPWRDDPASSDPAGAGASAPLNAGSGGTGGQGSWRQDTPAGGIAGAHEADGTSGTTGAPGVSDSSEANGGQDPWRDDPASSGAAGPSGVPDSGASAYDAELPWASGGRAAARGANEADGTTGATEADGQTDTAARSASAGATAEGGRPSGEPSGDLLADDPADSVDSTASAASDASAQDQDEDAGESRRGPDEAEPLPHRVPGTSPMSGAFRAVNPNAGTTGKADGDTGPSPSAPAGADEDGPASDENDYRPTDHDTWRPARASTREELVERLEALGTLQELGEGEIPSNVTERSAQLLEHAGARLNLSGDHTVVALAGGTGSGKSSLFNALCGLELSQTGITRPTTSKAHACVWGHEGADELLGWLGVPQRYRHSRTGVLDSGNSEMNGLVLLDLPDHDSVRSMHTAEADRLIGSVDLLVWVLDPQKYADAAVHHRYLAKMAGHGAVTVAVLNQVDRVGNEELEELLTDLRRLLESESGVHPRIITTSTTTDQGVDDLREFLVETVHERRALVDRLDADLDVIIGDFEPFQGEGEIPTTVSTEVRSSLQKGLSNAAGVSAVADVTEANDVRRGRRRVGWPVARRLAKLRKDPLAAVQLDFVRRDTENGVSGRVDAHEAELEKSLVEAADNVSEGMPSMWRRRLRAAARSGVGELPTELGKTVDAAVRGSERTPSWWAFARLVQYVLLGVAGVGAAWALVSAVSWLGGGITGLRVFDDPVFIAYSAAVVAASLVVGWLTGVGCGNLVEVAAVQRREEIERTADASMREIAGERVVRPLEAELERFRSFRRAYETARGPAEHGSGG
ncbi:GTPase [Nocardiopsis coralli]